ncbi:MAG: hypothetical protein HYS70_05990 [Nitrospinae bacterium]|nr:hypothetical protein [Nitrospinota bacterium]
MAGLWLPSYSFAQGIIEGKVINGTFPDRPVSVPEVALYRQQGNQPPEKLSSQPTPEGHYRFEGVPPDPQVRYHLATTYQGILQYGEEITFEAGHPPALGSPQTAPGSRGGSPITPAVPEKAESPGKPLKTSDLKVYEVTADAGQLSVSRAHIILDVMGQELTVTEFMILENPGNRAVWGKKLLRFSLPAGAQGFQGPGELTNEAAGGAGGFWLLEPIPPGQKQLLYGYSLPYSGKGQDFQRRIDLPTTQLDVLVADKGLEVSSPSLSFQGPVDMGNNQKFLRWSATGLRPATLIGLQFQAAGSTGRVFKGGAIAVVLLLVVGGFAYPFVRGRRAGRPGSSPPSAQTSGAAKEGMAPLKRERRRLLETIADLDDRYEAGEITEAEHRRSREPKFQQLVEITTRLRKDAKGRTDKARG